MKLLPRLKALRPSPSFGIADLAMILGVLTLIAHVGAEAMASDSTTTPAKGVIISSLTTTNPVHNAVAA